MFIIAALKRSIQFIQRVDNFIISSGGKCVFSQLFMLRIINIIIIKVPWLTNYVCVYSC